MTRPSWCGKVRQEWSPNEPDYVSITGMMLLSALHWPRFALLAGASTAQARSAPGNRSAEARQIGDVHHTLSVWGNRDALVQYLCNGAHPRAIRVFAKIGHGNTYGFETHSQLGWENVPRLYLQLATPV